MKPLEQPAFPLKENTRRALYWLTALGMAVATYLGAREVLDSIDMAFVTAVAGIVSGMAGVNTPKRPNGSGEPLARKK